MKALPPVCTLSLPAEGPRLAVNMGTGLNAAILHRLKKGLYAPTAEAGYMQLPMLETKANSILHTCADHFGAPVMEAVLSGPALPRLHKALTGEARSAREISQCWPEPTATLFARVLGADVGDLAIAHLPYGGIWLCGSLGVAAVPLLSHPAFQESFLHRGPYAEILKRMAINTLDDHFAALKSAAAYRSQAQAALD